MSDYNKLNSSLSGLSDPEKFQEPISIKNQQPGALKRMLKSINLKKKLKDKLIYVFLLITSLVLNKKSSSKISEEIL